MKKSLFGFIEKLYGLYVPFLCGNWVRATLHIPCGGKWFSCLGVTLGEGGLLDYSLTIMNNFVSDWSRRYTMDDRQKSPLLIV